MNNKINFPVYLLCAVLVCVVSAQSCNTPPDKKYLKDGKQYGVVKGIFRERWWNFYERGISYLEGGFYTEAIADLKEALRQRDKDQRQARTYGMHFIDYFPHRELGAAYFHSDRYADAQKELETSLASADSGRAKFYLNEARRAVLKTSHQDSSPPSISLATGTSAGIVNCFKINCAGVVEDNAYARQISINGESQFIELAEKKLSFAKEVPLRSGLNEIKIITSDLLGNVSEKTVAVTGDFAGPRIYITNVVDGQEIANKAITLRGTIADDTGIASLAINDRVINFKREHEAAFTHTIELIDGINRITIAATDIAGNKTTNELKLNHTPAHPDRAASAHPRNRLIRLALHGDTVLDTGALPLFATATPLLAASDVTLSLKELTDKQTVFYNTMYIDGSVSSPEEITAVLINGSAIPVRSGRTIYFNQLMELKPGDNVLSIDAQDKRGARISKTVTITYQVPSIRQIGSRMSLAILPFEVKGTVSFASNTVYDSLVTAFLNQDRFNIVSRGAELESALRELKLSTSDLADKSKALQVGKIVAAEGIVTGTINETPHSIEIYARLINTETSALMAAKDVYGENKDRAQVQFMVNGLALKYRHSFPLIEGIVIKATGKNIYADFGAASKVKKDMKFIVYRDGEVIIHPVTGKQLGSETIELGQARVVNVLEDMTIGKLVAEVLKGQRIRLKDRIITK
jgi:TolB-like protein